MSSAQYTHSKSFAKLKRVKEQIDTNLTSGQYLQLLDTFLYKAVEPIVEHTNQFEMFLCSLISWQEKHNKRKVSLVDRQAFSGLAVTWMLYPKWTKIAKLQSLKLDRGSLFEFARTFVRQLENYEAACNCRLYLGGKKLPISDMLAYKKDTEEAYGSSTALISVMQQVTYWLDEAEAFKCSILEKYIRLCLTTSQKDYTNYFDKAVPLDDIVQSYVLMASRSIDKCDFRQGVLTSHIQNWFLTARTFLEKNSKSDDLPDDASSSLEEECESTVDKMIRDEEAEYVRTIAKLVDPLGAGRAYLGILESKSVIEFKKEHNGLSRNTSQ